MKISIARRTSFEFLLRIENDAAFSGDLLAGLSDLEQRDRNLVYKLTLGVLRNNILIDHIIGSHSKTKVGKLDIEVLTILRLGVYQLVFMDRIPDYSAVNEMVELTKFARKKSASGFVNAILRKTAANEYTIPELPEPERTALLESHPDWLLQRWSVQYGKETAIAIAQANNTEPAAAFRFTARFRSLAPEKRSEIESRINDISGIRWSEIANGGFVCDLNGPELRELSDEGLIYFQDEASQMIAEAVVSVSGSRFLDVCAAPGGKAALIAASPGGPDLTVAGDIHFHRSQFLKENIAKQGVTAGIVCFDAICDLPFGEAAFDTVLVDAPCSGTGTIRRNPEIRYKISKEDIHNLQSKQLKILNSASKVLTQRGSLIYSTCSLEREENEDVIELFLSGNPGFRVVRIESKSADPETGFLKTFPAKDGSDGFFAARLMRI